MSKILYLNEEGSIDLIGPSTAMEEQVVEHPMTVEYTLEEFVDAFNKSDISHLGYIFLKREGEDVR